MTYIVKPGDSLSRIAKRFGLRVADLLIANPDVADPDLIRVGQRLVIPDGAATPVHTGAVDSGGSAPLPLAAAGEPGGLIYSSVLTPAFAAKAAAIAARLGVDPNHLIAVMAFESGGTFSPSIKNKFTNATGLIQFMPKTAKALGTSLAELAAMTAEAQLDVVERYFQPYRGRLKTLEDTYMAVLWPAAVGKPNDHVLFRQGTVAYTQNRGLDANGDGLITKAEAAAKVRAKLEAGRQLVATRTLATAARGGDARGRTAAARGDAGFDERAFVARVESAGVDELLRILARPNAAEERVLRVHLGDERFQRLHAKSVMRTATRGARANRGNVVVIHGIMGSDLSSRTHGGDLDRVWVNVPRLVLGRIERLRLNAEATAEADPTYEVLATGIMKRAYGDLLVRLAETWTVQAFWFDWRKDLTLAAAELHDRINEWFGDAPVHIVAHSMGGLVARTFIKKHRARWESMWDRKNAGQGGGRLVMLGTPNHGSFAIPQVLFGIEGMVRKLERFDVRHNMSELLGILNSFLGSYQMMPSPLKMKTMEPLYDADLYGALGVSQPHLDAAKRHHQLLADVIDRERMIYIAGDQQPTFCDLTDFDHPNIVEAYDVTTAGDGRVPHTLGLLESVPTYYADVDHGALATSDTVLGVLDEILSTGATPRLRTTRTRAAESRAAKVALRGQLVERRRREEEEIEALLPRLTSRAAQPSPLVSYDEHVVETVLLRDVLGDDGGDADAGFAPPVAAAALPPVAIEVALERQGIDAVGDAIDGRRVDAIAVGHYIDVRPQAAELALDRAISSALPGGGGDANLLLTQLTDRGTIKGELGRPFLLADPRRSDGARVIAIAGLGVPGRFGAPELAILVRELCWVLGRLGKRHLATVLIGAGNGNLAPRDAIRAWMRGIRNAVQATRGTPGEQRLARITFVEHDYGRVLELDRILREERDALATQLGLVIAYRPLTAAARRGLSQKAENVDIEAAKLRWRDEQIETATKRVPPADRLTVSTNQEGYSFGAITESASLPERIIPIDPRLVRDANDELVVERDPRAQVERGQFLGRLLFPHDFRPSLSSEAPLVLLLDSDSARIHWEMIAQTEIGQFAADKTVDSFFGTSRGITRQLRTAFAPPPQPPPPPQRVLRVLVVGDPADDAPLEGAQAEAQEVADLFERFNTVHGSTGNRVEVVSLIGPSEATRTNVLSRLMLEPFDVLHYAGHCTYDRDQPTASGWIFSGGTRISAAELNRLDRVPRFIFSNACESGITPERAGQRSVELAPTFAEAFFGRGVANFVCTAWPVDDAAAREFALALYGQLLGLNDDRTAAGAGFAQMYAAMRGARLAIAGSSGGFLTWGAYQHYGNPYFRLFESARTAAATRRRPAKPGPRKRVKAARARRAAPVQQAARKATTARQRKTARTRGDRKK